MYVSGIPRCDCYVLCVQDTKAVQLKLGLTLQQLLEVDTTVGSITGVYWINMEWKDEYLSWDEEKYGVG